MDVLKKIKSATLVEALVATVLIVVIFVVSSLVINNLLMNEFNNNTTEVENRLYQLEYAYENNTIQIPYHETFQNWDISIDKVTTPNTGIKMIELKAKKDQKKKELIKHRIDEK